MGGGDRGSAAKGAAADHTASAQATATTADEYIEKIADRTKEFITKHRHTPVGEQARPVSEFPRISIPITRLKGKYDVVVVGSGYGASVSASRLSRAGKSVCVLELGKEVVPGEYAKTLEQVHQLALR
jgi:NADPH-dependent 2,4-dienoyl-CoA reductase/sulfur reductase-like enzyme